MKPLFKNELNWKGTVFIEEFFADTDFSNISPITQVQAVTFVDKDNVALFQHIDGYFSLPGGKVELDENLEESLRRECIEEMQAGIVSFAPIGYLRNYPKEKPENVTYNVRYVALVKLLDKPIEDPCKKAVGRVVVPVSQASLKLGWGKKSDILIKKAKEIFTKNQF